jgi:hypothetical protein
MARGFKALHGPWRPWIPKYVIGCLMDMNSIIFHYIFHHTNILWSRLCVAGLLPLARVGAGGPDAGRASPEDHYKQFGFHYGLVSTLLDRWHLETHTFHFPGGWRWLSRTWPSCLGYRVEVTRWGCATSPSRGIRVYLTGLRQSSATPPSHCCPLPPSDSRTDHCLVAVVQRTYLDNFI